MVERILTDNGGCYRSAAFAAACDELGLGHRRTRPYRPRTNVKAERIVRTYSPSGPTDGRLPTPRERIASLPRHLDSYG
jgi:transposase InsO family protein